LPIRGDVMFPKTIKRLKFGRERSVAALNRAMGLPDVIHDYTGARNGTAAVFTQRINVDSPTHADLYNVGCVVRFTDGIYAEGIWHVELFPLERVRLLSVTEGERSATAHIESFATEHTTDIASLAPLCTAIKQRARELFEARPSLPAGALELVDALEPEDLVNMLGAEVVDTDAQQRVLDAPDLGEQLRMLLAALAAQAPG